MFKKFAVGAGALLMSFCVHATPLAYEFTVSGNWFDLGDTPFDMPLSPSLKGTITVDSSTSEIDAFSLTTGTKTWTLADNPQDKYAVLDGDELIDFGLWNFLSMDGSLTIFSNNTMSVFEYSPWRGNACNDCVSIGQRISNNVPEPNSSYLLAFGAAALAASFRKRRKAGN